MPDAQLLNACVDCKVVEASIDVRKRWLCHDCFVRYITSKAVKRIESYRLRSETTQGAQKLLVPVSGGVSSVVLLHILDHQIHRQLSRSGHAKYDLLVLIVETPSLQSSQYVATSFNGLKNAFPSHSFSVIPLSEVFELDRDIIRDLSALGAERGETPAASLDNLLSFTRTASSRVDVLQLLLTRLIVAVAKSNACEAVLWGHSDSRLAAKGLSSVVQGRGGYLPFDIADGPSPWGIKFYYPLRDLFKSELVAYASTQKDTFLELIAPEPAAALRPTSTRPISIDDLLSNYIFSQGEKYPSIMANVVRTAGKLQAPVSQPMQALSACSICAMPLPKTLMLNGNTGRSSICRACRRLASEMRTDHDFEKVSNSDLTIIHSGERSEVFAFSSRFQ